jgi:uncharacterized protein
MLKFLLLILILLGVWYGFRYVNRPQGDKRRPPQAPPRAGAGGDRGAAPSQGQPQPRAEDMTACPVCGTYVAESTARSCGRGDCPYPAA